MAQGNGGETVKHKEHLDWIRSNDPVPKDGQASAFIGWKSTDICMDLTCTCGNQSHICCHFAYYVECVECGAVWAMAQHVTATKLEGERLAFVEEEYSMVIQRDET